ncbi:solute carrier family 22 member 15-like isoform X2 [Dendronephthya gigantea]|nr:solute carrier family 22 member 15-like isoform X2 [Dendronephthya gigantea]XP_028391758.1 solute carrier family 22 member 15-like isoform X2 [Dendronephthya gigantea]
MGKTVDEILEVIGQMGRFQISRLAMFCCLVFAPTFHLLNMFFIGAEAPWQCVKNSTECKLNGTFAAGDDDYNFRCNINRSEWEFADYEGPKDSIISQFDLVCDDAFKGWLAKSMVYIGMTVVTIPLGMISDRYGRLITLYPSLFVIIFVGFASAFATEYWQFLVSRFFVGSVIYGAYFPIFILSGEFVGPKYRPLSQTVMWFAFSVILLLLALMAFFVRTWRTLMILCNAPWVFVFIFWKFTPESIRWYMTHEKIEKAEGELRDIARVNRKEYPQEILKIPPSSTKSLSCIALFSSWTLAISALIQAFTWFINGMVYYGASYGASDLGGSMYLNYALTSLIEIPANFLVVDNCERFGRKKTVIFHMILGGIACFVVSLIPAGVDRTDFIVGRVIGGMLGKGFITVSFNSIYVWSGEIFPTVARNSGMAFVGVMSRIGAVSAPFVVELKRIHPTLPFGLMGGLAVIAALGCLILPETRGRPTAEVYDTNNDAAEEFILQRNGRNDDEESPTEDAGKGTEA